MSKLRSFMEGFTYGASRALVVVTIVLFIALVFG